MITRACKREIERGRAWKRDLEMNVLASGQMG
jgi:hypothetical protein